MNSIISYIGSLNTSRKEESVIPSGLPVWDGDLSFAENIVKFPASEQLRCYLDQAIAISYYITFFGKKCHETIYEFINEFDIHLVSSGLRRMRNEFKEEPWRRLVNALEVLSAYIHGQEWKPGLNIEAVTEFLTNKEYFVTPSAWFNGRKALKTRNFFAPYLTWMNARVLSDDIKVDGKKMGLVGFKFGYPCRWDPKTESHVALQKIPLETYTYSIGTSFSMKETPLDREFSNFSLLGYLSHFDMSQCNLEKVIGILSDLALHLDDSYQGQTASHLLCSALQACISNRYAINGTASQPNVAMRIIPPSGFRAVSVLFNYMASAYSIKLEYPRLVARLFNCLAENKEQHDAVDCILSQGGGASADSLNAYNKVFGSLEALQFISQSPTLLSAQSQVTDAAEDEGTEKKDDKSEPKKTEGTKEEAEPKEGQQKPEEESDDTDPSDGEEDADTDMGEDDTASEDPDDNQGSEPSEPDATQGEAQPDVTDMPSQEETPQEKQMDSNDEEGIPFRVADPESETADSVMLRQEIDHFLSNLLANPPDDMSPQDIETLTVIQKCWLYVLDVESIVGIVGRCCTLPESLTKLNTKCTE